MGKKLSCCRNNTPSPFKQKDSQHNLTASEIKFDETVSSLQHISEREAGDTEGDPSTSPTCGPLFVEKCAQQSK